MRHSEKFNTLETSEILQKLIQLETLTVAELARRIGLPQPTIQRIVSGAYKQPRTSTLEPIAQYFNVTINQLRGLDPIFSIVKENRFIKAIPLLDQKQATNWPDIEHKFSQHVICDNDLSEKAFAMYMPDRSMEPEISKGSTLLVDPSRVPNHGSYIVVKLNAYPLLLVRQLITNTTDRFIKPLSADLNNLELIILKNEDLIKGVVVEIRFCCE